MKRHQAREPQAIGYYSVSLIGRGHRVVGIGLLLVWLTLSAAMAGTLSYPALGNIMQREGCIEMWLTPLFEPHAAELLARPFWRSDLIDVRESEETFFNIIWRVHAGKSGPFARHRVAGVKLPVNWLTAPKWSADKPHHIAYCWQEGSDWWIMNGVKYKSVRQQALLPLPNNEQGVIVIGDSRYHGRFVVADLRISSRPRTEDEVGFHTPGKLQSDHWTLLLDTFDNVTEENGLRQTKPAVMMPSMDGKLHGGSLSPEVRLRPFFAGQGVEL